MAAREASEAGTRAGAAEMARGDGAPGAATLTSGREGGGRKARLADETRRTTGLSSMAEGGATRHATDCARERADTTSDGGGAAGAALRAGTDEQREDETLNNRREDPFG